MHIGALRTDQEYHIALAQIDADWDAPEGSTAGNRLVVLVQLVENYETRGWSMEGIRPSAHTHRAGSLSVNPSPSATAAP